MKVLKIAILISIFCSAGAFGQDYFFRQYSNEEGLYHSFIYDVNQDADGYLWIGTGEGLYKFDGLNFEYFTTENGLADNFITRIFRDKRGVLWIGHQNGAISAGSGKNFETVKESADAHGSVTDLAEDDAGLVWATLQNHGLIQINQQWAWKQIAFIEYDPLSQIEYLGDGRFLIGSQENLYISAHQGESDTMVISNRVEAYPGSKVVSILPGSDGSYIIVSRDYGIYEFAFDSHTEGYDFSTIDENPEGELDNLQGGIFDGKGTLWLNSMGNGLLQYVKSEDGHFTRVGHATARNGLISDNVRSLFKDGDGNLWLGMYGEGLLRYVDNSVRFYRYHAETGSDRTYTVTGDMGGLYTVIGNRLLSLGPSGEKVIISVPLPEIHTGDIVNTAYLAEDGRLWLGYEKSGLHVFGPSGFNDVFLSEDDLANSVNHITGKEGHIWVGTKKGICLISGENQQIRWFTTEQGLPHNNIQQLYIDSKGRVLVATLCHEIFYVNEQGDAGRLENSGMGFMNSLMSITEDREGNIWAGTQGNGVWQMAAGGKYNYTRTSGLLSDFCYSLTNTPEGMVVVGHRGGISRINPGSDRIRTFSRLEGISSSVELYPNAIFSDHLGSVWFGTSEGLVKYSSKLSAGSESPPRLKIGALYVDGEQIDHSAGSVLLKPGYYELAVEYIGIHLSNPEMVVYQTRLEGYNKNWSDLTSARRVVYDRVGHGQYTFMIKAFNENNVESEITSGFALRIKKPVYITAWFYIVIFIVLSFFVYLIIRLRERNQIRFQKSLQEQLNERTREVIQQKEEIEVKNKDITDSINYAQKIQSSMLPPVRKLLEKFTGAFVFYQPKDIVSGDFYWYGEFSNDIFVVACADATGHGVPGAFMSMIGTTLLKDLGGTRSVNTPAKLLTRLDEEVRTVLSQNQENGGSNDGMDIAIAEINLRSREINTASAMRPMIIYRNGEPIFVGANRFSIGGQYEYGKKVFDNHEYKLTKGDKIYMFTDGYADQFGGPDGKKFKSGNVKKLLDEIHEKTMDEQYDIISSTFLSWKGDQQQVDDVLFIGIEL